MSHELRDGLESVAAQAPSVPLDWSAVQTEARRRVRRRRLSMAVPALALIVAAPVVSSFAAGGDSLVQQAAPAPEPDAAIGSLPVLFGITFTDASAYERHGEAVGACVILPGTSYMGSRLSDPPLLSVTVTGTAEVRAFESCLNGLDGVTVSRSEATWPGDAVPGVDGDLRPPAAAGMLVLCHIPFSGGPSTGRADCAVTDDTKALNTVRNDLAALVRLPPPPEGVESSTCAIAAARWELIWLDGEAIADRVTVPDASCLAARRAEGISHTVSESLVATLRALHEAEAGQGGAFDGLADPAPVAATCVRFYPQDLAGRPVAFDGVVLGVSDTDPADAPESPRVPFSDLDVLVLDRYAGQPAERLTVRALVGRPDPDRAVGERLLVATDDPPELGSCGFTQPHSKETAQTWADAFR